MRVLLMLGGLAAGLVGLGIDAWEIFPSVMTATPANPLPRSLPDAFVYFWTYFTHLTNLGLLAIYVAELTGWRWLGWGRTAAARAIGASYIALVGLFYHVMLAPTLQMEGALAVATWLLHYATPAVFLLWWLASPHGALRFRRIPLLLVPGLAYVGYVLGRGAMVGEYPYDILDAGKFGYVQVGIGTGVLIAAVALFCVLLVGVDAWLARRALPRSGA
ncbi:MAG: Pr6Pr family membrane protein [Devosia sp.]|nr:Pr6Pr family membrane protein [Devosia sp.]